VLPDHILGTRFWYNEATGEVNSINRAAAGSGKIAVLVPVLEKTMNWNSAEIRRFLGSCGLALLEWDRMHTDILTIQESGVQVAKLSDDNAAAPQRVAQ
jgi:hypothetical protein